MKISTMQDGSVRIVEGKAISVLVPGSNTSSYSLEVKQACKDAWSEEVLAAFNKTIQQQEKLSEVDVIHLVQSIIDSEAIKRGYDNIVSACSYAGYENKFQNEAIQLGKWRSAVWEFCYQCIDAIRSGAKTMPKRNEIAGLLPKIADFKQQ